MRQKVILPSSELHHDVRQKEILLTSELHHDVGKWKETLLTSDLHLDAKRERALTQTKHHLKQTGTGSQQNNPNIRVTQQRETPQAQITPSVANWPRGTAEQSQHQSCIMM